MYLCDVDVMFFFLSLLKRSNNGGENYTKKMKGDLVSLLLMLWVMCVQTWGLVSQLFFGYFN